MKPKTGYWALPEHGLKAAFLNFGPYDPHTQNITRATHENHKTGVIAQDIKFLMVGQESKQGQKRL